jgi:hypothetical protein
MWLLQLDSFSYLNFYILDEYHFQIHKIDLIFGNYCPKRPLQQLVRINDWFD